MKRITKAVFPVAGLGTRFLPATKASPKEMMPIVDKPLIQYAVEEALASGIEQMIFVTGRHKEALEDHFDRSCELEHTLMLRGKDAIFHEITSLVPESGSMIYTRQNEPLGLGHAIWCARHIVGDEPFAVLLADDLVKTHKPVLRQMLEQFEKLQSSIVAVEAVAPSETNKYGILDVAPGTGSVMNIRGMVEKPDPADAPSNWAIIGRYILMPEIFDMLEKKETGAGGEIQITDAMAKLLASQPIYGYAFEGKRFDCGNKAGFQMANIAYALEYPDIRERLLSFLQECVAAEHAESN